MIVSIPIFLSNDKIDTKVEIQIRTIAMDFWASLDHKLRYKQKDIPDNVIDEVYGCSQVIRDLDMKMENLKQKLI